MERIVQTSSSILPALDTVRIAASIQMLTAGMNRGESYRVTSLTVPNTSPLHLRDLCLILNLFPTFSPDYKLREEQCYWFCNVALSMASVGCSGVSLKQEDGWGRAGKFGQFSVPISGPAQRTFVDTFTAVCQLGNKANGVPIPTLLSRNKAIVLLIKLLSVPSHDAQRRATIVLGFLAELSLKHRQTILDAGAEAKLLGLILTDCHRSA
jgi:hypothetical protein